MAWKNGVTQVDLLDLPYDLSEYMIEMETEYVSALPKSPTG